MTIGTGATNRHRFYEDALAMLLGAMLVSLGVALYANLTGADLSGAELGGVISSGIVGTPRALPSGSVWVAMATRMASTLAVLITEPVSRFLCWALNSA